MKRSGTNPTSVAQKWTKEDVHRWLTTEVKVQEAVADTFLEEEVSGEILVDFKKTDILDMGIKHGPAVKITSHLERLREPSQQETLFPAYLENWRKEQVKQWFVQHVRLYSKYAERLHQEDVSGDCLVCFKKQDLLDLDIKHGPAAKILAELYRLKEKPEPKLEPQSSTELKEGPKPQQPNSPSKAEAEMMENKSGIGQMAFGKSSEKEIQPLKPQKLGARRKETAVVGFSLVLYHVEHYICSNKPKRQEKNLPVNTYTGPGIIADLCIYTHTQVLT